MWVEVFADVLRSFVYVHKATYTVTCTVTIVLVVFPKCHTRISIELYAASAFRELYHCELYHPFEYKGTIVYKLLTYFAQWYGTSDISSTFKILSARVYQYAAFRVYLFTAVFGS